MVAWWILAAVCFLFINWASAEIGGSILYSRAINEWTPFVLELIPNADSKEVQEIMQSKQAGAQRRGCLTLFYGVVWLIATSGFGLSVWQIAR